MQTIPITDHADNVCIFSSLREVPSNSDGYVTGAGTIACPMTPHWACITISLSGNLNAHECGIGIYVGSGELRMALTCHSLFCSANVLTTMAGGDLVFSFVYPPADTNPDARTVDVFKVEGQSDKIEYYKVRRENLGGGTKCLVELL